MRDFLALLGRNRNYRYTWMGQVVSEVGDHFNTIAVLGLALDNNSSGLVVSGIMLSRAIPAIAVGPLAGVILDRFDRRLIMLASDLTRAVMALGFILAIGARSNSLLYLFSALLMVASPFFTSGRAAILPVIASREELHTANSLTQTTQWTTLTVGAFLGGTSVKPFGYEWAFVFNAFSFLFSGFCIWMLRAPKGGGFRAERKNLNEAEVVRPWHEYKEGLRYMRSVPLVLGIALLAVGWATGGGAAQILFSLFGVKVFNKGPLGIGVIWGCAGVGLLIGGAFAHWLGKRISFEGYKVTVFIDYLLHGSTYVLFSQMRVFSDALVFITLSRTAMAVNSVLNYSWLLRVVPDEFRGRVFATMETFTWGMMMLSMTGAGIASTHYSPRTIGTVAGLLSSTTAIFWGWANWTGRLKHPIPAGVEPNEVEVHGDPVQ
ncbi:MAG TPA: MFS transporter [Bryobacteraceae bacterium]|nr:MFS transporter [Bryobacteraceae bacterium]